MTSSNQKIARLLSGTSLTPKQKIEARSILRNRRKLTVPFRVEGTPFPVGLKQMFLPNFEIALLRSNPKSPPDWAEFQVPLNINKLDLRDYLWHVYGVHARAIRVEIEQPEIKKREGDHKRTNTWHQPRSTKRMVVEMDRPFVWPAEPDSQDLEAWDKKSGDIRKSRMDEFATNQSAQNAYLTEQEKNDLMLRRSDLAQRLVEGKEAWKANRVAGESLANRIGMDTLRGGSR